MAFKSRVRIRDSDPGFRKLRKRFEGPDKVDVGVFGEQGSDLVIKAASNEFGTNRIPERSFIRSAIDESKDEFRNFLRDGTIKVLKGKMTKRRLIGLLGLLGIEKIQEKITDGPFVPNAPSTIKAKGSSSPLIHHAILKGSITSRLEGKVKKKGK
jgi:hypothetical protein